MGGRCDTALRGILVSKHVTFTPWYGQLVLGNTLREQTKYGKCENQYLTTMTIDCNIFNPVILRYLPNYKTILSGIFHMRILILLHSEKPKWYAILAFLSAIGLKEIVFCTKWDRKNQLRIISGAYYNLANTVQVLPFINNPKDLGGARF